MFEDLSGPGLAAALATVEVGRLEADAALEFALACQRVVSWASERELVSLAAVEERYPEIRPLSDRERAITHEVSAAYGCSQSAADVKVDLGARMAELPAACAALRDGRIDLSRARMLVERVRVLTDPAQRREVAEQVLSAHAAAPDGLTTRQWGVVCTRAVAAIDPTAAEQRQQQSKAERHVRHDPPTAAGDFGTLVVSGPAEQTAACEASIDALARRWRDEGRLGTLEQLRFDAAVYLLTHVPSGPVRGGEPTTPCLGRPDGGASVPEPGAGPWDTAGRRGPGPSVIVNLTMPLTTLLGLDDAGGEVPGAGPVPASVAREMAASASVWRRLLTDPVDGHVVTQEVKAYRPTAAMRRFVLARNGAVCASRGCGRRRGLQLDHTEAHPRGPTSSTNLLPLCPGDHEDKTRKRWRHQVDPSTGVLTQTTVLGLVHHTGPLPPPGPSGQIADPVPCADCLTDSPPPSRLDEEPPPREAPPTEAEQSAAPPDRHADDDPWPRLEARMAHEQRVDRAVRTAAARARIVRDRQHREALAEHARRVEHARARSEGAA